MPGGGGGGWGEGGATLCQGVVASGLPCAASQAAIPDHRWSSESGIPLPVPANGRVGIGRRSVLSRRVRSMGATHESAHRPPSHQKLEPVRPTTPSTPGRLQDAGTAATRKQKETALHAISHGARPGVVRHPSTRPMIRSAPSLARATSNLLRHPPTPPQGHRLARAHSNGSMPRLLGLPTPSVPSEGCVRAVPSLHFTEMVGPLSIWQCLGPSAACMPHTEFPHNLWFPWHTPSGPLSAAASPSFRMPQVRSTTHSASPSRLSTTSSSPP